MLCKGITKVVPFGMEKMEIKGEKYGQIMQNTSYYFRYSGASRPLANGIFNLPYCP